MGRARGSAFARIARPGGGGAPAEDDEDDDEQEETSVSDLTSEADPNQFDQTFTDSDAALTIQGAFDPVAGPKQVIPRVAFVLNYNLIYNEERGRWEPQKKSDLAAEDDDITEIGAAGTLTGLLVGIDELEATVITDAVDETETATEANLSSNVTVT
jgi:hypothetical protein